MVCCKRAYDKHKKTKVQYFLSNRNSAFENNHPICIKNRLNFVSSYKYLGTELDRNMNMKGQFEYLYKIVNHKLFLLKTIRPCLTTKAALLDHSCRLYLMIYTPLQSSLYWQFLGLW